MYDNHNIRNGEKQFRTIILTLLNYHERNTKMKLTTIIFSILMTITLAAAQVESIQDWSKLLGKITSNMNNEIQEQAAFDVDLSAMRKKIGQLETKMGKERDRYIMDQLQAEIYSLNSEVLLGQVIQMERKLEMAHVFNSMMVSLTNSLFNNTGQSKLQKKFKDLSEKEEQYKMNLKKTDQLLNDLVSYLPVSSKGIQSINNYRRATQNKIQRQKANNIKFTTIYNKQYDILEGIQLKLVNGFDPISIEISILDLELDLQLIMLNSATHNITVQGDFLMEMMD